MVGSTTVQVGHANMQRYALEHGTHWHCALATKVGVHMFDSGSMRSAITGVIRLKVINQVSYFMRSPPPRPTLGNFRTYSDTKKFNELNGGSCHHVWNVYILD